MSWQDVRSFYEDPDTIGMAMTVVSLQWKGLGTPVEFRGEGDTELRAWGDLLDKISGFEREIENELGTLKETAWAKYEDARVTQEGDGAEDRET